MKYFKQIINEKTNSRTSHEVRGLKFSTISMESRSLPSHLTRGAWIEIYLRCVIAPMIKCRTSHEVRGLKWENNPIKRNINASHLTRGAWIEITRQRKSKEEIQVAPHTRCVD